MSLKEDITQLALKDIQSNIKLIAIFAYKLCCTIFETVFFVENKGI